MSFRLLNGFGPKNRSHSLTTRSATFLLLFSLGLALTGCPGKKPGDGSTDSSQLIQKGRTVYQTTCIACHNADPKKPGSLGPDVFGSSKELLESRIMGGDYPKDYKPKRPTHLMPPMPYLKDKIDGLHAYLNQPQN